MNIAIYPGSFDPITRGHLEVIKRSLKIFDKIVILVAVNSAKTSLFTNQEKVKMISESIIEFADRVEVVETNDLTIDYAVKVKAKAIIRGLRALTDFEHEFQLAAVNKFLNNEIETVFLMADQTNAFISSSSIKTMFKGGADISQLVPQPVLEAMKEKVKI